jgi:hypothetical protein
MARGDLENVSLHLDPPAEITVDLTNSDSWAWLHLPPFDITEQTVDIKVDFDAISGNSKQGMEWDFLRRQQANNIFGAGKKKLLKNSLKEKVAIFFKMDGSRVYSVVYIK